MSWWFLYFWTCFISVIQCKWHFCLRRCSASTIKLKKTTTKHTRSYTQRNLPTSQWFTMPLISTNIRSLLRKRSKQYSASTFFSSRPLFEIYSSFAFPDCILEMTWWRNHVKARRRAFNSLHRDKLQRERGLHSSRLKKKTTRRNKNKSKEQLSLNLGCTAPPQILLHAVQQKLGCLAVILKYFPFTDIYKTTQNHKNWIIKALVIYLKTAHECLAVIICFCYFPSVVEEHWSRNPF